MKKLTTTPLIIILLAIITSSVAYAAPGDIWLAGYLLLTFKTPTEVKALEARVDIVQQRANDLLGLRNDLPKVEVRKAHGEVSIYADNKVFLTVTPADARASNTSVDKLANSWATRLRTILPEATPIKH